MDTTTTRAGAQEQSKSRLPKDWHHTPYFPSVELREDDETDNEVRTNLHFFNMPQEKFSDKPSHEARGTAAVIQTSDKQTPPPPLTDTSIHTTRRNRPAKSPGTSKSARWRSRPSRQTSTSRTGAPSARGTSATGPTCPSSGTRRVYTGRRACGGAACAPTTARAGTGARWTRSRQGRTRTA